MYQGPFRANFSFKLCFRVAFPNIAYFLDVGSLNLTANFIQFVLDGMTVNQVKHELSSMFKIARTL